MEDIQMKFLVIQVTIVTLVCIFIAALSNLTELGLSGWIITASTGYCIYKIYKQIQYNLKLMERKERNRYSTLEEQDLSSQVQYFIFDDATKLRDE